VSEEAPLWKQAFDAFEKAVGPELEALVRQAPFQDAYANWIKIQQRARKEAVRGFQQWWRFWGLATTEDVAVLSAQVATLEQELREARRQAEAQDAHDEPARPRRARGTPAA
jgi:hypothetical protein